MIKKTKFYSLKPIQNYQANEELKNEEKQAPK